MSVAALEVITEAAQAIGDPRFDRISRPAWRTILNQAQRDMARKLKLVRWAALFDIETDHEYAYPDDCVQCISFRYTASPSDPKTFLWLGEMFEDEFRTATNGTYATGDPTDYYAMTDGFHLYPEPTTFVAQGGKIEYWGMPDAVTDEGTQPITIRDIARDTLRERMGILANRQLERFDRAAKAEEEWIASLTTDRLKLEDRSADRRPRLRTRPTSFGER